MRSMTGYGRGECTLCERHFVAEIKSVNHKYNDITIRGPKFFAKYEDSIRKMVSGEIKRGKIDVSIGFETNSEKDIKISVNNALADSYFNALKSIKERYSLQDDVTLSALSEIYGVISIDREVEDDSIWEGIETALREALDMIIKMRLKEGTALKENIALKLKIIDKNLKIIEKRAPLAIEKYRKRLLTNLAELGNIRIDENRIAAEVLIFSDKVCIDEEITRLKSHIIQMRNILEEEEPVGRKLDFLSQEMNREANTISSKANDVDITNCTVEMKSEIEKIREQIQNLE